MTILLLIAPTTRSATASAPDQELGALHLVEGSDYVVSEDGQTYHLTRDAVVRILEARDELRAEIQDLEAIASRREALIASLETSLEWEQGFAQDAREEADDAWAAYDHAELRKQIWRGIAIGEAGGIIALILEALF